MIRVLHILSSLEGSGGVQAMLQNYYRNMDHDAIVFDFIVHDPAHGELEEWFIARGSRVFHVPPKRKGLLRNLSAIRRIIRAGHYDIVHNHQQYYAMPSLLFARLLGVPVRIAHGHGTALPKGVRALRRKLCIRLLPFSATDYFACSRAAAETAFGPLAAKAHILPNVIRLSAYTFSEDLRRATRRTLSIGEKICIGHIGRFMPEKNHAFLLEILKKCENTILLLVGDGPLLPEIRSKAQDAALSDRIRFVGYQKDILPYLCAMDIFVLPSLSEGFGMAAVESQAVGLRTLVSDAIPDDIMLTPLIRRLPLSAEMFVRAIKEAEPNLNPCYHADIRRAGFDAEESGAVLSRLYAHCLSLHAQTE